MQESPGAGPNVRVEQESESSGKTTSQWNVCWRVYNGGKRILLIHSARLPHGRFRSKEKKWHPPLELVPNGSATFKIPVFCDVQDNTPVENGFIILRTQWQDQTWLILVRVRVEFTQRGVPKGITQVITTQPVGFSKHFRESGRSPD